MFMTESLDAHTARDNSEQSRTLPVPALACDHVLAVPAHDKQHRTHFGHARCSVHATCLTYLHAGASTQDFRNAAWFNA